MFSGPLFIDIYYSAMCLSNSDHHNPSTFVLSVNNDKMSLGCSDPRKSKQPSGCRPENRKANTTNEMIAQISDELPSNLAGIQLTTSAIAKADSSCDPPF